MQHWVHRSILYVFMVAGVPATDQSSGPPAVCYEDIPLGPISNRTLFHPIIHTILFRTNSWYVYQISRVAQNTDSTGKLVDRYGARGIAVLGFIFNLPVFLLLQLVKNNSAGHVALLYIFLFLAGVASNLANVALMVVVTDVVDAVEKDYPGIFGKQGGTGQAYGLYNVAWSGGQVLGPLFAGYLMDAHGWATMVTVFGVMSGMTGVILGVTGPRGFRFWRR